MDDRIERKLGMPISAYFQEWGEEQFRREEAELATELLRDAAGGVVALGGGSVLSEGVQNELRRHIVVWLPVTVDVAWARVADSDRPLAQDRNAFAELLTKREPLYEELADVVLPRNDGKSAINALPWIRALSALPPDTKLIWAVGERDEHPIYVGSGILDTDWWPVKSRRFLVTDRSVGRLYADRIAPHEALVEVEPGEEAKTLSEVERILRCLAQTGMRREDHVVALGGGVVGDLAGFCAHVYQRGVPVIQVPTTLVAQVDSAYGGKTGVDLPEGKNYAGGYHLPAAVIADTSTLESLPAVGLAVGVR